jgi:hypothetical protein
MRRASFRAFAADSLTLLGFLTTIGIINERFTAGMAWHQVLDAHLMGGLPMVPLGRPHEIWRDWMMRHSHHERVSQFLWDCLALVGFQVPTYAEIIAFSGATGAGVLRGVLGAAAMMIVLGRPDGAFRGWVQRRFGLLAGGHKSIAA